MYFYAGTVEMGRRGYYNTNLEAIRKDVECTFDILKKRWRILDYGLKKYCMKDCEKVYTVCCVLHNVLLGLDENFGISCVAQRGCPSTGDSQWLEGPEPRGDDSMVHG